MLKLPFFFCLSFPLNLLWIIWTSISHGHDHNAELHSKKSDHLFQPQNYMWWLMASSQQWIIRLKAWYEKCFEKQVESNITLEIITKSHSINPSMHIDLSHTTVEHQTWIPMYLLIILHLILVFDQPLNWNVGQFTIIYRIMWKHNKK